MEEIISKKYCTGCTACMNICPKRAISMKIDSEGFRYPVIDEATCVNCGLCKRICPVLHTKENESLNKCYVGYVKDEKYSNNSSSGGIFPLIAERILNEKGIVIGAAFDKDNKLKHTAITEKEELIKLKGSKYLQSELDNIFIYIKNNIETKKILYVGTPCQVAGLKAFLKKDYNNLICIDLFCHGVPSPKLFDKYVKELEKEQNDKLIKYDFRDKSTGWESYSNTAIFKDNIKKELQKDNNYMKLFLSDVALRDSCFNCNFKLGNKYSDITLGDFWGVQNKYPEMYNKNGVSAIIVNTKKGIDAFKTISNEVCWKECKLNEIVSGNPMIKESTSRPKGRDKFFKEIDNYKTDELVEKFRKKKTIKRRIISILKKMTKGNH